MTAHPEYQKKFSLFADVPRSELMRNGNFLGQSYTILAGLTEVIEAMGSKANLAKEVNHLGAAHFKRGVTPSMFEVNIYETMPFLKFLFLLIIVTNQPHHR